MNKPANPRLADNRELVRLLGELVEQYPSLRFGQILSSFEFIVSHHGASEIKIVDEYYVEPEAILKRVKEAVSKITQS